MSERIARLRIELQELEPKIRRRFDMPLSTTLDALYEAIQMTMGWTFSQLWASEIDSRCYGDSSFREFDDEPPVYKVCQRRSKISPPGRSKTSPLNVMRYAVLGGCPGSP